MKPKKQTAKKETYWLPTARSPWAVIFYLRSRKRWDFYNAYYHRETARSMASHMKTRPDVIKARVVRAWIPLQQPPAARSAPADAASVEAMVEQGADAIHNEYIFTSTGELNRAAIARAVLAANGIKGGAK